MMTSSNQISLTDIFTLISPVTSSSSSASTDTTEFATNAIAELIRKRRNRLETEKTAKSQSPEMIFEATTSVDDEENIGSPPKMTKLEEQQISTPPNENKVEQQQQISAVTNESLLTDTTNALSALNTPDSFTLSLLSNLSSFSSQLNQSSATTLTPPPLLSPSSDPLLPAITPQKTIGDEFATVCGRLSLLNVQKYVVTVGEMARRVFGAEEFSFSLIGGILRRAKTPSTTNALKAELASVGIHIDRGRRRNVRLTLFGGLLEGEAVQLGNEFNTLLDATFPSQIIAKYLEATTAEQEKLKRINELQTARKLINEFLNILNQDSSPIMDSYPVPTLPDSVQNPLTNFSIMTHGFGMIAIKSVMEMYGKTLDAQIIALSS